MHYRRILTSTICEVCATIQPPTLEVFFRPAQRLSGSIDVTLTSARPARATAVVPVPGIDPSSVAYPPLTGSAHLNMRVLPCHESLARRMRLPDRVRVHCES
jgi:hypothetical protein